MDKIEILLHKLIVSLSKIVTNKTYINFGGEECFWNNSQELLEGPCEHFRI